MKKLSFILLMSLGLSCVGCSNNDSEVKDLQEQLTKLEQQLNESEKQIEEDTAECAFCRKEYKISELNARHNSEGEIDYYYCNCQYVSKETKESNKYQDVCIKCRKTTLVDKETNLCDNCKDYGQCYDCGEFKLIKCMTYNGRSYHCGCIKDSSDFTCPICGGINTCPENSECLNSPKDSDYICNMCGKQGTCTETDCYSEVPYGYCDNPDCGMPLESSGYCDDCGDAYARVNCESCGKETYAYEQTYGMCSTCKE